ncbi:hypothetical protein CMK12_15715 [Candidatus Poribacteria bacterium]|nr:hypothetical protein [Candidatus Poribacteria bacterium]
MATPLGLRQCSSAESTKFLFGAFVSLASIVKSSQEAWPTKILLPFNLHFTITAAENPPIVFASGYQSYKSTMNQQKIDQLLTQLAPPFNPTETEEEQITEQILAELSPLIENLVRRWANLASNQDRQDYLQTTVMLILQKIRSSQPPLEINSSYVGLKVKQAIYGGEERKQRNRIESQVTNQFDQNCHLERDKYEQQDPNPTEDGFQRYRADWIGEQVNQINNQPEIIGANQEAGEIDLADPSASMPEFWDTDLERLHLCFGQALCDQRNHSPPRLVHIFYQVEVLKSSGIDIATELNVHPSTVTRNCQSARKILAHQSENEIEWVSAYWAWLLDGLANQVAFQDRQDLRYLTTTGIGEEEEKVRGQVMWAIYDWVIKNWCLIQFNEPRRINLNNDWLIVIDCDYEQDKVMITKVWRQ